MIAVDTSSLVAYFSGDSGKDVAVLDEALENKQIVLPPMVLTEILSDPKLPKLFQKHISSLPQLEILENFWYKAGLLRAKVLVKGYKARLADSLIAQICLDHKVPLITRDKDFRHYVKIAGLKVLA